MSEAQYFRKQIFLPTERIIASILSSNYDMVISADLVFDLLGFINYGHGMHCRNMDTIIIVTFDYIHKKSNIWQI